MTVSYAVDSGFDSRLRPQRQRAMREASTYAARNPRRVIFCGCGPKLQGFARRYGTYVCPKCLKEQKA